MKILIAGDSTVTEQPRCTPYNPGLCYCGWGQMLYKFLIGYIEVKNFAKNGLTVETFLNEGHYTKLLSCLSSGDYVLFQFGHNDQKCFYLKANGGYSEALKVYSEEIRKEEAKSIFVTPVARNSWRVDNGEYNDLITPFEVRSKILRIFSFSNSVKYILYIHVCYAKIITVK